MATNKYQQPRALGLVVEAIVDNVTSIVLDSRDLAVSAVQIKDGDALKVCSLFTLSLTSLAVRCWGGHRFGSTIDH